MYKEGLSMKIKVGRNILKYRTSQKVTQAQLASYLCISPQAVSKWEQEITVPDVYLIPKIAFFFGVTTDALFGISNYENTELLVDKYGIMKQEQIYIEAKDSIVTLLENKQDDVKALSLLSKLESFHGNAFIERSMQASKKVLELATVGSNLHHLSKVNVMKKSAMLGDFSFINEMREIFESERTAVAFNDYVLALLTKFQYSEIIDLSKKYFDSFSEQDQYLISPNLMETTFAMNDLEATKFYFNVICRSENSPQIFSAWWIMWKMHKNLGLINEANQCVEKLKELLPKQGYSDYKISIFNKRLNIEEFN
mgnify:CR=1 FL=1